MGSPSSTNTYLVIFCYNDTRLSLVYLVKINTKQINMHFVMSCDGTNTSFHVFISTPGNYSLQGNHALEGMSFSPPLYPGKQRIENHCFVLCTNLRSADTITRPCAPRIPKTDDNDM